MMERFPLQGCKKVMADKNNKNKVMTVDKNKKNKVKP
jgi:hypothetical protein